MNDKFVVARTTSLPRSRKLLANSFGLTPACLRESDLVLACGLKGVGYGYCIRRTLANPAIEITAN